MPAVALIVLPLLLRRRFPAAPAAVWLTAAGLSFLDGRLVVFSVTSSVAGMVASFLLGNLRDDTQARIDLAVVAAGGDRRLQQPPPRGGRARLRPVLFAIGWLAGYALRERAAQAGGSGERALQAERERESAARVAVAEERARIARELHDVVAHAVSVMVLQVGAVRHQLPESLAEDKDALSSVRAAPRSPRCAASSAPCTTATPSSRPSPASTARRARRARRSRRAARTPSRRGRRRAPPARRRPLRVPDRAEGLTNSLKHAQASRADVTVRYGPDGWGSRSRRRGRRSAERRAWPRPRRRPRARQDLRRRDGCRHCTRRRFRPQRATPGRSGRAMRIRVLVADDQSLVRGGFRMLLAGEPDIEIVAEASNGLEAVEKAARFQPTVVLMDIRMPELDGLEATRRILAADDGARVLVITTFDLDEYVFEALRIGASGFVLKDEPPSTCSPRSGRSPQATRCSRPRSRSA